MKGENNVNRFTRLLNSKKGASLVIVIVVFAVISILGTTLLTVASFNQKNSILYHNQRQAYYTARSVAETMVERMYNVTDCTNLLSNLTVGVPVTSETTTVDNMGSYYVVAELLKDEIGKRQVKFTAYATYGVSSPASSNVSVILKEGKGNRINPIEFTFFANNGGMRQQNTAPSRVTKINGDVLSRGSLTMKKTQFNGNLLSVGSFNLTDNSKVTGAKNRVIVENSDDVGGGGGEIKIDSTTMIEGDFYTTNDSTVYDKSEADSEFIARNSVTITPKPDGSGPDFDKHFGITLNEIGMNGSVQRDLKPLGDSIIYNNSSIIYLYNGCVYNFNNKELSFPDGSAVSLWDTGGKVKDKWEDRTQLEPGFEDRTTPDNPLIFYNGTSVNFDTEIVTFADGLCINLGSKTIYSDTFSYDIATSVVTNASGISKPFNDVSIRWNADTNKYDCIDKGALIGSIPVLLISGNNQTILRDCSMNFDGSNVSDCEVTFDTTYLNDDIYVYVTGANNVTLQNVKFKIIGDHNVYIFMKSGKQWTCKNGTILGENSNEGTQLYLIGADAKLELDGDSYFRGIAYLYGAHSKYTDGYSSAVKLDGSVTAMEVELADGNTYNYLEYFKEPDFNATLRMDVFFIYPPQPPGLIPWDATYVE